MSHTTFENPNDIPGPILAGLTRKLLVDPLAEKAEPQLQSLNPDEWLALAVLADSVKVSVDRLAHSHADMLRVLNFVAVLLNPNVVDPARGRRAVERLTQKGQLPTDAYAIVFPDSWKEFEGRGEREAPIERVIRHPDSVQHLLTKETETRDFARISLFAQRVKTQRGAFVMLVIAERKDLTLTVHAAWRIPEDIVLNNPGAPLVVMFEQFLHRVGLEFRLGDRPDLMRFALYEVFPLPNHHGKGGSLISIPEHRKQDIHMSMLIRVSTLNVAEVALAYVVDLPAYRRLKS